MTADEFYRNILCLENKKLIYDLISSTEIRHLKKGEFVVHIGEVQNDIYFMESGIARTFFLDTNGKEVTECFSFRCGTAVLSMNRLEQNCPSPMAIEVIEDGFFFCVPISVIIQLQKQYQEVTTIYNQMLIAAADTHCMLRHILSSYSAMQRYQWFLEEYPGIIHRVSHKYIASFLGMTPVTLSRLRKTLREEETLDSKTE